MLRRLFFLTLFVHLVRAEYSCNAGSLYTEVTPIYTIAGWYLNLQLPLSCSGNISAINIHYYDPILPSTYCVWWALWEPEDAVNYTKVKYYNNYVECIIIICYRLITA